MVSRTLIMLLPFIQSVFGHKCYVCAPDNGKPEDVSQLKRTFPNVKIPVCSEYKHSLQSSYLLDCPTNNNGGCLTKFEDDGSIMRTCAPIGIDDCKAANGVNYCYCSTEGCNTPERRLSHPEGWSPKPRQGHEIDFSAPRIQEVVPADDDEDHFEGSGGEEDWGFYYDSYYDTAFERTGWNDTDSEPGFGDPYEYDMTELPPYIEKELEEELEKISRLPTNTRDPGHRELDEIIIVEETAATMRPSSGAQRSTAAAVCFLLLSYTFS